MAFSEDQRVAGGDRFDFCEAQGVVADVAEFSDGSALVTVSSVAGLSAATELGHADLAELIEGYAQAAVMLAGPELDWVAEGRDPDAIAERAVIGTVLGDAVLTALWRLTSPNESARRQRWW